jgi:hypothetical protein
MVPSATPTSLPTAMERSEMPVSPRQEQQIDAWLAAHGKPRACPECHSEQRRIDLSPPPRPRRTMYPQPSPSSYDMLPAPIPRIEITCLTCAAVRILDARTVGISEELGRAVLRRRRGPVSPE